jgi:predicted DNA-binding protein
MSILKKDIPKKTKLRRSFNLKIENIKKLEELSKETNINKSSIVNQALNHLFEELEKEKLEKNKQEIEKE